MKTDKTLFMIDDDLEDQEIFTETVNAIDPEIKCLNFICARNALRALEEGNILPSFIFTDWNMPIMDGYEFLKEIKKHDNLNHIPVIIYTTTSEAKFKEEAFKLGAAHFITKPYDLAELKKELKEIFTSISHSI